VLVGQQFLVLSKSLLSCRSTSQFVDEVKPWRTFDDHDPRSTISRRLLPLMLQGCGCGQDEFIKVCIYILLSMSDCSGFLRLLHNLVFHFSQYLSETISQNFSKAIYKRITLEWRYFGSPTTTKKRQKFESSRMMQTFSARLPLLLKCISATKDDKFRSFRGHQVISPCRLRSVIRHTPYVPVFCSKITLFVHMPNTIWHLFV
jgi:hypothetical protein